jgi:hypothetical protein
MHPVHMIALEAARYRGHGSGILVQYLFRWLFSVMGGWAWLVIGALVGLGLWAKATER